MGRVGVGRMRRMGIACMGSGGGHRKNAEDGMERMGRMGIACLGIVAVDTAKTLKMEWEGWEGWESRVWVVAVDTAKTLKMHAAVASMRFLA